MNTVVIIGILLVLGWSLVYTISYGIWTIRENKRGGIALIVLAIVSVIVPLWILWVRIK